MLVEVGVRVTRYLFRFAHLAHAFLGLALGLLVYLIDVYTPETVHPILWIILTIVLIVNGLLLGRITRRLYLKGYLDNLTGLGNKGFFYLQLRLEMSQIKDQLSLAMMDVDNFKKINDTYGHPAGDIVLKDLAKILKHNVRKIDTVLIDNSINLSNGHAVHRFVCHAFGHCAFVGINIFVSDKIQFFVVKQTVDAI